MDIILAHSKTENLLGDPIVEGLWNAISDGALLIDAADRRILAMNRKARNLLGYDEQKVLGCQCRKMMNSPACTLACPLTAAFEGRESATQLQLYYRGQDGRQLLHASTRLLLLRGPDGKPLAGIELFSDLREVRDLQKALRSRSQLTGIVGHSPPMQALYETVEQIAPFPIPVLISGESGVGKERFADALVFHSARPEGPYLKINCAALSPALVESALFGHKRGTFTGASADRKGYFEEANGGTLLLDEIAELPGDIQAKLLRVLQNGEIQRLGDDRVRKVDVRVLAASNRPIEQEVAAGRFRADLYYRVAGAKLHIPPLRERREDILALATHFLDRFQTELTHTRTRFPLLSLDPAALAVLLARDWPGNVRELEQALRLAAIKAQATGRILPRHLEPAPIFGAPGGEALSLAEMEHQAIGLALQSTGGNLTSAARILGIDRSTLWRKIKKSNGRESNPKGA